jgi:tetratricopeptide (TPR) repeat protein
MAKRSSGPAAARERARTSAPAKDAGGTSRPSPVPAASGNGPGAPSAAASTAALREFELAMASMQRHEYASARAQFQLLLASFPGERALLERVRVFVALCEREMRKAPVEPATVEERVTLATAALNNGDDRAAERLASEVLRSLPEHDLALYILAAVQSRRGDSQAAIEFLRHAVQVSPDISAQARHDSDFAGLRSLPDFQELLDPPAVNGVSHGQPHRQVPRRSDR